MKVLVLTSEPIDRTALDGVLEGDPSEAEVLVVSPALNQSPLAYWMSDSDEAIAEAQATSDTTASSLRDDHVEAGSEVGESDPLVAIQDALATFAAEQIVIFTHAGDEKRYREKDVVAQARERFSVPVVAATV